MLRGSDTGCLFHLPWLSEDVLDLGVELSGASLHEAPQRVSDSRSVGSVVGSGAPKLSVFHKAVACTPCQASIVRAFLGGLVWGHGLQARGCLRNRIICVMVCVDVHRWRGDLLVWIEGRPTSEMSPEEVSEELPHPQTKGKIFAFSLQCRAPGPELCSVS